MLRDLMIPLVLAAATFAVYAPVRHFGFVMYDDLSYVPETPQVAAGLTWRGVLWAFGSGTLANWHPVTWISHMLDVQIFGLDAGAHHVTSLLLHVASTVLVFLVLRRMTRAVWPSALTAALFGLHPLHVESVAWIAERKDVLSTFFFLLMLLAYAFYVEKPSAGRYLGVLGLFALGLMAKPMLVTAPFVLLLLDVWPLGRLGGLRPNERSGELDITAVGLIPTAAGVGTWTRGLPRLVLEKVPFLVLAAASSVVTFVVQRGSGAVVAVDAYPVAERLANAVMSYGRYVGKTLWPAGLAAFYPYPAAWPLWEVAGMGAVLAAVTCFVILDARRRPYLAVGWLWYLGTLVPVIGLVQVGMQSMADRYTYIPSIGLFLALSWGLEDLAARWRLAVPLRAVAAAAVAVLAVVTSSQVRVWENTVTLFEHALETTSANPVAHNILGLALVRSGRIDEGIAHFTEALRIKPHHATHFNLGLALAMRGRFDEAIAHYREAIHGNPDDPRSWSYLGDALFHQEDLHGAQSAYEASLRLNPAQAAVLTNLGACLSEQHRTADAVERYEQALRVDPLHAEALNNLAVALAGQGKTDEAIARYTEAVRVKPDYADAQMNLANLLAGRGRGEEAAGHYEAVLRIRPNDPAAQSGLRRARAQQGR